VQLKLQKSLLTAAKIVVVLAFLWWSTQLLFKISWSEFKFVRLKFWYLLLIAITMVVFNWGAEFLKWQFTLKNVGLPSSTKVILKSLLAGISTGLVSPNRIGNFIGRMVFFHPKKRALVILGSLYGNLAQFVASVFIGLAGLFFVGEKLMAERFHQPFIWVMVVITLIVMFFYLSFPWIPASLFKRLLFRRANVVVDFQLKAKQLIIPLIYWSLVRYLIFTTQYVLLLLAFGAPFSWGLVSGIFLTYLITSLVPGVVMGKLLVRETAAILVLSPFISNPSIILVASVSLWLINLAFPALVGLFVFLKSKSDDNPILV
jgi:uncharacterized membrane protein YbhN (UPF0104 family)